MTGAQQTGELATPQTIANNSNKGHFDKKGFQILNSMFDDAN